MKPSAEVRDRDSHAESRGAVVVLVGFVASLIAVIYSFAQSSRLPAADRWLHCVLFADLSVAVGLYVWSRRLRSAPIDETRGGKDADSEGHRGAERASKAHEDALRIIRDRLAEASRLATVGELSASIAHEINQPLSAVVSNGDACIRWLNASPPNLERARSAAQMIVRDAKSAADVVRGTRALFKHTDSDRAFIDTNDVIREVLQLMQGEITSKGIIVSADLGGEIPPVFADRVHVQQILINLVQNGIDAMDEIRDRPKLLVLRSHIQGPRFVTIQVKDSGTGIPDPNTIFEPFFTTKEKGLGVGLSICRSIVEAHAGHLWATADAGGGSTFEFTLPINEMADP